MPIEIASQADPIAAGQALYMGGQVTQNNENFKHGLQQQQNETDIARLNEQANQNLAENAYRQQALAQQASEGQAQRAHALQAIAAQATASQQTHTANLTSDENLRIRRLDAAQRSIDSDPNLPPALYNAQSDAIRYARAGITGQLHSLPGTQGGGGGVSGSRQMQGGGGQSPIGIAQGGQTPLQAGITAIGQGAMGGMGALPAAAPGAGAGTPQSGQYRPPAQQQQWQPGLTNPLTGSTQGDLPNTFHNSNGSVWSQDQHGNAVYNRGTSMTNAERIDAANNLVRNTATTTSPLTYIQADQQIEEREIARQNRETERMRLTRRTPAQVADESGHQESIGAIGAARQSLPPTPEFAAVQRDIASLPMGPNGQREIPLDLIARETAARETMANRPAHRAMQEIESILSSHRSPRDVTPAERSRIRELIDSLPQAQAEQVWRSLGVNTPQRQANAQPWADENLPSDNRASTPRDVAPRGQADAGPRYDSVGNGVGGTQTRPISQGSSARSFIRVPDVSHIVQPGAPPQGANAFNPLNYIHSPALDEFARNQERMTNANQMRNSPPASVQRNPDGTPLIRGVVDVVEEPRPPHPAETSTHHAVWHPLPDSLVNGIRHTGRGEWRIERR